jgi:hypothetical protein
VYFCILNNILFLQPDFSDQDLKRKPAMAK